MNTMVDLKTILIVEDNPQDVELTLEALSTHNLANNVIAKAKEIAGNLKNETINFIKNSRPIIKSAITVAADFLYGNKVKYTYAFLMGFFISSFIGCQIVFIAVLIRKIGEMILVLKETDYKIAIAVIIGAMLVF